MRCPNLPYPVFLSKEVPRFAFPKMKLLPELHTVERPELSHSDAYSRKFTTLPALDTDDYPELFENGLLGLCANIRLGTPQCPRRGATFNAIRSQNRFLADLPPQTTAAPSASPPSPPPPAACYLPATHPAPNPAPATNPHIHAGRMRSAPDVVAK